VFVQLESAHIVHLCLYNLDWSLCEEKISEKFHLDFVSNKSEIGVSIKKEIVYNQVIF
jgi:hypothetical protein